MYHSFARTTEGGTAQPNETKPLFCWFAPVGSGAPWKVGGSSCRLLFERSPTQQNDRGFVALGGEFRAVGPGLAAKMFAIGKPGYGPGFFAEYQGKPQARPGGCAARLTIYGKVNRKKIRWGAKGSGPGARRSDVRKGGEEMARPKVPHCKDCPYLEDRRRDWGLAWRNAYGLWYCRERCLYISGQEVRTSPRWCPNRHYRV